MTIVIPATPIVGLGDLFSEKDQLELEEGVRPTQRQCYCKTLFALVDVHFNGVLTWHFLR